MQNQSRPKRTTEELLRAIDTCPTIDKLFALVKNEHIVIQMKSFNSASSLPKEAPKPIPDLSPLDSLKIQVRQAVMDEARRQSASVPYQPQTHTKEQIIRAIETCPTIDKLFELVKRENIVIQMKSFNSASNLPQLKPSEMQLVPDKSPLERLKEQVVNAVRDASRKHTKEQLIRAVETCPTSDKLFELVKNEHIVIRMKSFNSASNLPRQNPSELQMIPDKSPLDRLKEQVVEAIKYSN